MARPGPDFAMVPFTKEWHSQPYPFISPTRSELSAKGKNIVITGGATGIGNAIGVAFAQAGARSIAIIGRRPDKLASGVSTISKAAADGTTTIFHQTADLANHEQSIKAFNAIATKVGKIDVLVSNAASLTESGPIANYSVPDLTEAFNLNVVTALNTFQAFLPHASSSAPVVINITTALAHITPWFDAGAYPIVKAAALKLWDQIAQENKHLRIVNVHPGWVPTDLNGHHKDAPDSVELPGQFVVWVSSPEAAFLSGKLVWANWDAEELSQRSDEIKSSRKLTWVLNGVDM
ncbi:hypothetical protein H2200_008742 [Cladophialophora chaetospira]|uniref:NAD(P)-binding protein n=1 Tax=Cladophialophora chaetospira TaxID=386627 RepID=A0AA38X4X8_9EURO|nr:hypothetical protein H2200_008742 [Cladophialophora chaetospira]